MCLVILDLYATLFRGIILGHLSKHLQHTSINVLNEIHNLEGVDTNVSVHGSVTVWLGCQYSVNIVGAMTIPGSGGLIPIGIRPRQTPQPLYPKFCSYPCLQCLHTQTRHNLMRQISF